MAYQAPYSGLAQLMEMQGRGPDTRLVHMTPMELRTLQAMSPTGRLTTNPETGLPEAGILEDILPIALPIAGSFLFPMAAPALAASLGPVAAGAVGTGLGSAASGLIQGRGLGESLIQGGLSGLMSYGLGSAMGAFAPSGGVTAPPPADIGAITPGGAEAVASDVLSGAGGLMAPSNITSTVQPTFADITSPAVTMTQALPDAASMATLQQTTAAAADPGLGGFLGRTATTPVAPETMANVFGADTMSQMAQLGATPTYGSLAGAGLSGMTAPAIGEELGLLTPQYDYVEAPYELAYDDYYDRIPDLEENRRIGRERARRLNTPPAYASPSELMQMATTRGFGTFLAADGGRVPKNLNINGQPHELSYINQDEADLLRSLGGAGQNVMGIPAYFDAGEGTAGEGAADDGSGVGAAADGSDSAPGAGMGVGGYSDEQAAAVTDAMSTMADMSSVGMDPMGVVGNVNDPNQAATMGVGASQNAPTAITAPPPNIGFLGRAALGLFGLAPKGFTVNPDMTYQSHMGLGIPGISNAVMSGMGMDTSLGTISSQTMSPGGGDTGDDDDGTDGGGGIDYRRPYGDPYNTGGTA